MVVDPSTFQTVAAAGATNTAVLAWLVRAVLRLQRKVDITEVHLRYVRREVAYLNGFAEPVDNQEAMGGSE